MSSGIMKGQLVGDQHSIDAVAIGNGILAGLVAITAGADCIHGDWAIVVGAGGAVSYFIGAQMCERFELDDVVEAWPVHGLCGIWGCAAKLIPTLALVRRTALRRARSAATHFAARAARCLSTAVNRFLVLSADVWTAYVCVTVARRAGRSPSVFSTRRLGS